jgi:hypothetical protein
MAQQAKPGGRQAGEPAESPPTAAGADESNASDQPPESAQVADTDSAAESATVQAPDAATNAPGPAAPDQRGVPGGPRTKRREVAIAGGQRLILNPDRSIELREAAGGAIRSIDPADPDWARYALRFGLRPVNRTANPHSRRIEDTKPPGW